MTLRVSATNKANLNFVSLTKYCASTAGIVDLSKEPPIDHPEYNDVNRMGIFWSMKPLPNSHDRFWTNNVVDGLFCDFRVYKGNIIYYFLRNASE